MEVPGLPDDFPELERARLDNERTRLAYILTALELAALGVLLAVFGGALALGPLLIAGGAGTLAVGVWRSARVARRLKRLHPKA